MALHSLLRSTGIEVAWAKERPPGLTALQEALHRGDRRRRRSISQWPAFRTVTSCTFVAASRICTATLAPKTFSAPMRSTGIVSFVSIGLRLSATSFWSIARN